MTVSPISTENLSKRFNVGHYRSPEYNEHFCYKLEFLASQKPRQSYCEISPKSKQETQPCRGLILDTGVSKAVLQLLEN